MADHNSILRDLQGGNFKSVYFLHGDEPYFIDLVEQFIANNIVEESAQGFDRTILYGKETDLLTVVNSAKRYPMMSPKQVVIVREAQNIRKFDELIKYLEAPQPQTILCFAYKGKKLDARVEKKLKGDIEFLFSKKLYDNQIPDWIKGLASKKKIGIDVKASVLLSEFLGNDLSKIANEVDKLILNLKEGEQITPELIEQNIGVSKDFNTFELVNAFATKDVVKVNRIVNYFASNSKNHPFVVTVMTLYNFFSKILLFHFTENKSDGNLAKVLKVNPYFLKDYQTAAMHYDKSKVAFIIDALNEYDLKSKGYMNTTTSEGELLKELSFKILH